MNNTKMKAVNCQGKSEVKSPVDLIEALAPTPFECSQLIALFNAGRHVELESTARLMIERYPDSGFVWKILGVALYAQKKDFLSAMKRSVELLPDDAEAHSNLGNVLRDIGRLDDAVASCRRALEIKPDYAEAHSNLGNALKDLGQLDDAVASYRQALELKPDYAEAHSNLGNALKDLGQLDDAAASYRQALELKPDYAEAHSNLGNALRDLGQLDGAVASCHRALELKPDLAEAHSNLGNALRDIGRIDDAVVSCRRALELKPDFAEAHSNLGNVLRDLGQLDDAVASYRRALELKPDFAEAHSNLGNALRDLGQLDDAVASYRRALELKPDYIEVRLNLAQAGRVVAGDENFAALVALDNSPPIGTSPLSERKALFLSFALGKCYDDIGNHGKAFSCFLDGCRQKRASFDYDPNQTTQLFTEIMRVFDAATIDRLRGGGDPSHLPIFVLGMPRSGTTLIEQIIASHPEVHGAGELHDLMAIAQNNIADTSFPDNLRSLDQAQLVALGTRYVAGLQRRAPDMRRITDKMPENFLIVALIHLMLPNAKIIHVNRNPVDTCLSCFTQLFTFGQQHTYDLAELGLYYADYFRLMQHWRTVLPSDAFLDVRYEDVVADQEAQSRRIVEYCGLEWDEACLDFHKNKRAIQTASVMQVRQPIYRSSVERWKKYESFLAPLLDALGDLALE